MSGWQITAPPTPTPTDKKQGAQFGPWVEFLKGYRNAARAASARKPERLTPRKRV